MIGSVDDQTGIDTWNRRSALWRDSVTTAWPLVIRSRWYDARSSPDVNAFVRRAASQRAVLAPAPAAGVIGCTASPSSVTRSDDQDGTSMHVRSVIGKAASTSAASTNARIAGCQSATDRVTISHRSAGLIVKSSSSDAPSTSFVPV